MNVYTRVILQKAWSAVDEVIMSDDEDIEDQELGDSIAMFHNVVGAFLGKIENSEYPVTDPARYARAREEFVKTLAELAKE